MKFDKLSNQVIECAIDVHRNLGPGLLQSTYEQCLAKHISLRFQNSLPVKYKMIKLDYDYRVDILIEDKLNMELKSVETVLPIHEAQFLAYMKLAKIKKGLLINSTARRL